MSISSGFIGPYPVGDVLGYGAFSRVFASTAPDGTPVVLKVAARRGGSAGLTRGIYFPAQAMIFPTGGAPVREEFTADQVCDVFAAEVAFLRAGGRRVPRLVDQQMHGDRPVLVLERLQRQWSAREVPGEFVELLRGLAELASAVGRAHGDLKPEHIFRREDGVFAFIDPGFADASGRRALTPEFNPWMVTGAASDVCAVAVMLYRHYTGNFPPVSPWMTGGPDADQPRLCDISPAPTGVGEWVDAVLRPTQASGAMASAAWPRWVHSHAEAADALASAMQRPIVESAAHALPRTRSQISATTPLGWFVKESWTLLHPSGQCNVICSREPLDPSIDALRYANIQGDLLRKEFPHFAEYSFGPFVFASGQTGYLREFSWTPPDGVPVRQMQTYYANDGTGFTSTATAALSVSDQHRGTFLMVLQSMRFA